jgi:diguanylate cyclase (GGDEF)-like protein
MKKVLVVEDSPMVMKIIKHVMGQNRFFDAVYADSFAQAQALIEQLGQTLFAAVVDLNLPDAPDGEIVDFCLKKKLPCIVLTGSFDAQRREKLLGKGVVDYVTKEGRFSYVYVSNLLVRLIKNAQIKVLVVDDSSTGRKFICQLLHLQHYQVLEAVDGIDAIKMVIDHPDIRLLITDYNMPRMDGFELVQNLRVKYEKTDLVIIGLSSESDGSLSAKFIKNGANDFLRKPFNHEEFFCRVTHNVELLEMIETIRDSAYRDFHTGAYNRHYFFEQGHMQLLAARDKPVSVAAVVLDLDGFRDINLRFGNEIGDQIMRHIAERLMQSFGRFLLARAGGQEFYALLVGLDNTKAVALLEKIKDIVRAPLALGEHILSVSFSAGVSNRGDYDLDAMINQANLCLLRSKEAGGGIVVGDEEDEDN